VASWVPATVRSGEAVPDAMTALWKDHGCVFLELQPLSRAERGGERGLLVRPPDFYLHRYPQRTHAGPCRSSTPTAGTCRW
jgi:hypothetical protein